MHIRNLWYASRPNATVTVFRQGPVCLAIFTRDDKDSIWIQRPHEAKGCNANNLENPQKSTHPLKKNGNFHIASEHRPKPKRKGSSSNHFGGAFAVKFWGCKFINGCSPVFSLSKVTQWNICWRWQTEFRRKRRHHEKSVSSREKSVSSRETSVSSRGGWCYVSFLIQEWLPRFFFWNKNGCS